MQKHFVVLAVLAVTGCTFPGKNQDNVGRTKSPITPQQTACSTLDESACLARADCEGRYCPPCDPANGGACPMCTSNFLGCQDKPAPSDGCSGLDEAQCNANSLCHANYSAVDCAPCPQGTVCSPCPGPTFTSCSLNLPPQDPCVGLDEAMCTMKEPFCQPQYAAVAMVCPPAQDGGCDMTPIYLGCHGGVRSCLTNCDCAVNEYCSMKYVQPEPPEVFSEDGGIARCMSAPTPVGICTPAPNETPIYPVDPTEPKDMDGGSAPTP